MKDFAKVMIGLLALSGASVPLAAQQLSDAQRSAIKSACRGDYQNVCASVPPGTKDALQCLLDHSQQVSSGCRDALAPAAAATNGNAAAQANAVAPPVAAAGAATAGTPPAAPPLSPREQARVLRAQCGTDFQKFCANVQLGAGRGAACLRQHASDLTPGCRSALASAAPQ